MVLFFGQSEHIIPYFQAYKNYNANVFLNLENKLSYAHESNCEYNPQEKN